MSALIRLQLSQQSLKLDPGQRSDLTLTVQNFGEVVDRYRIAVEGVDPSWVTISRPELALFPQDQDQVRITLHPPAGPEAQAGRYEIALRVISQEDPSRASAVSATLEVSTAANLELALQPSRKTAPEEGRFALQAANRGNLEMTVGFEASDPEGCCNYHFEPQEAVLPAGQERSIELLVKPKAPLGEKASRTHAFTVTARPVGHPQLAAKTGGVWEEVPPGRLPWWAWVAALGGLLLIAAAVVFLVWKPFEGTPEPTAVSLLPTAAPTTQQPAVVPTDTPSPTEEAAPTDTPSPTEEAAPTDTPSPTEEAVPTDTPPPTVPPTVPTATATATPTEACVAYDPALEPVLLPAELAGLDMGCATEPAFTIDGAAQEFWANVTHPNPSFHYRSLMIWRSDNRDILVLDGEDTDASQADLLAYTDTWEEGDPEIPPACAGMTPPTPSYQLPIRGFGRVWCANALWDRVGWPNESEAVAQLTIQPTQYGLLMRVTFAGQEYLVAAHYPMARAVTIMAGP